MSKKSKKESTLYYFHSVGCAFCKRIDPIVEKLNDEGYDILRLDLSEKDNQGLHREIENKYDLRCGTPFLVDGSNGRNICLILALNSFFNRRTALLYISN